MFAKLKKKIQEEAQNVVTAVEGDQRPTAKATSPAPGLASPVNKDYPGGPIFSHSRKDSSDMSSKMGSRTSSVDDIENSRLDVELHKAEEYTGRYSKTEEENDELQGLTARELAKVKHVLLNTQAELKQKSRDLVSSNRTVHNLETEIKSLLQQITVLTSECEEMEETNKSRTHNTENAQSMEQKTKLKRESRDALEEKLANLREHLSESKSSSAQKLVLLEQEISELQQQVKDSADSTEKHHKDLQDVRNSLKKEVDSWKSRLQMALVEVKEKDRLLEKAKENKEADLIRYQKNSSALEEGFRDQLRQLKLQLDSSERVRERERSVAQEKITKLENTQEDWLEREIDAERQITRLEEDLQKAKVEVSEKDKDILNMKKQLIMKKKELEESEMKKQALERTVESHRHETQSYESSLSALQRELHDCNLERDDLLLRNAQLSQEFESHKRKAAQHLMNVQQEVTRREAAVSGLEQSVIDLQCEGQQQGEKLKTLETQRESTLDRMESDEITRLKQELSSFEAQLMDKTKTIKMLQQRLTDLKKTLQRELKVQALPNDEPSDRLTASSSNKEIRENPPNEAANGLHNSASVLDIKPETSYPLIPLLQSSHQHFPAKISHGPHRSANSAYMRPYPPDVYRDGLAMGKDMSVTGHGSYHGLSSHDGKWKEHSCGELNFEYLKHVVLKFMLSHEHEAVHLIKAIAVLLHFSPEEQRLLKETLEWKMSWFGTKPQLGKGQQAKVVPSPYN